VEIENRDRNVAAEIDEKPMRWL